jgi:hypothetical protein
MILNPHQNLISVIQSKSIDELKNWMRVKVNKELLNQYWLSTYHNVQLLNVGEVVFCIKFNESPFCKNGNRRTFKQFPKGYYNACGVEPGKKCPCLMDVILPKIDAKNKNRSKEEKQRILDKTKATCIKNFGYDNIFKVPNFADRITDTIKKLYGVDKIIDVPGVREQKKATSQKNWGKDHPRQSKIIVDKTNATNMEKYGNNCPMHFPEIEAKVKETMMERFGVENYFDTEENQNKMKERRKEKCGYENYGSSLVSVVSRKILDDKSLFIETVTGRSYESAAKKIGVSPQTVNAYAEKYEAQSYLRPGTGSTNQLEIFEWLTELGFNAVYNTRSIIPPKEIDIWLPDYNLGIEYNGIYRHSEFSGGKDKNYHSAKLQLCKDKNIDLIQICSLHYDNKLDVVRGIILRRLNATNKIQSKDCLVKKVAFDDASTFAISNRVTDLLLNTDSINMGLMCNDQIIQLISFNLIVEGIWEIEVVRSNNFDVIGGFNQILRFFIDKFKPKIISTKVDLRYYSGEELSVFGFKYKAHLTPTCRYVYNYWTLEQQSEGIKQELTLNGFDLITHNRASLQELKYDIVWDCGYEIWQLSIN